LSFIRVLARPPQSAPLPQQIPALIQFNPDITQPGPVLVRHRVLDMKPVLLVNQFLYVVQHRLIGRVIIHLFLRRTHGS